jgi:hypothetical protein
MQKLSRSTAKPSHLRLVLTIRLYSLRHSAATRVKQISFSVQYENGRGNSGLFLLSNSIHRKLQHDVLEGWDQGLSLNPMLVEQPVLEPNFSLSRLVLPESESHNASMRPICVSELVIHIQGDSSFGAQAQSCCHRNLLLSCLEDSAITAHRCIRYFSLSFETSVRHFAVISSTSNSNVQICPMWLCMAYPLALRSGDAGSLTSNLSPSALRTVSHKQVLAGKSMGCKTNRMSYTGVTQAQSLGMSLGWLRDFFFVRFFFLAQSHFGFARHNQVSLSYKNTLALFSIANEVLTDSNR